MQGETGLLIFVCLVALSSADLSANGCNNYNCKLSTQRFTTNTCVYYSSKVLTYYVQPCTTQDTYCPPDNQSNSTCQTLPNITNSGWPGEKCSTNNDCNFYAYKGCVSGICTGAPKGYGCHDSNYCNPGLYCNKRFCTPQIQVGQTGCSTDFDCVNGAGCDFTGDVTNSTCVNYLSLAAHSPVSQCKKNQNKLCKSSLCAELNGANYCVMQLNSFNYIPTPCQYSSDCVSTSDPFFGNNFELTSSCDCAYNTGSSRYCSLFPGDQPGQLYLNQLALWYQSAEMNNCNTLRRHDEDCMSSWWDSKNTTYYMWYNLNYKLYSFSQNTPDCVAQVYLQNWWEAKQNFQKFQG